MPGGRLLGAWLIAALACCPALAATARAEYRVLETPHLRLIYQHPAQDFIVDHTARCFENSLRFHSRIFQYPPHEKITLILDDQSDFANAGVWCAPRATGARGSSSSR